METGTSPVALCAAFSRAELWATRLRRRKARLATPPEALAKGGGARRIRTDDILLAKQALYQLSYGPFAKNSIGRPDKI